MTIQEYTERTGSALQQNHPRNYPAYADDPIACWRYVCRCYGAVTPCSVEAPLFPIYRKWIAYTLQCGYSETPGLVDTANRIPLQGWEAQSR
jgi:hypothetical protein